MRTLGYLFGFAAIGAAIASGAQPAQEKAAARSADEAAIRALGDRFIKAFNAGDAKAIAALHAPDARMIDVLDQAVEGRRAIEDEYARLFHDSPGMTIAVKVGSLHLLGPETAIEEGESRITPKGGPTEANRYTVVYVKRDGNWLMASVREAPGPKPSAMESVAVLAWMLGDWVDESDDSVVISSCRWAPGKTAIVREFTIQVHGRTAMTGSQRIGWDPRTEQIKSWESDSQGGHGESLWARRGDHWVVKATGVLRDGRTATATHYITPAGKNSCRWRTVDRTVGGDVLPDVQEFVMARTPPKPGAR